MYAFRKATTYMTATQLLFLQDDEKQETVAHAYVSMHPSSDCYVVTLLVSGKVEHTQVDRWQDRDNVVTSVLQRLGYTIRGKRDWERSPLRAARWNGLIHIVHGEEAAPLVEDEAISVSAQNTDELRQYFAEKIPAAVPAYAELLRRWTTDETIRWNVLSADLRRVVQNKDEDSEGFDAGAPDPGEYIREACQLSFNPPPRCPECGVGITASGRGEPFALNKNGLPLCRLHGEEANPNYSAVLNEYWNWRAQRAHSLRTMTR